MALGAASLAWLLVLIPVTVLGNTCLDHDQPHELLGGSEMRTGVTAIA